MADLEIVVTPRASSDSVARAGTGQLRVRVTRPPTEGEANRAVIRLVARALKVSPSSVTLLSGARGRRKRLRIDGVSEAELAERVLAIGD